MVFTRRQVATLALLIFAFTALVSAVGLWKYDHYRYRGLDLAIYADVLSTSSFSSSIQGHSYLADHVEPVLLAITPLFRLWPDARLLIILQALVLALSAIPVFFLICHWSFVIGHFRPALLAGLYLLNPLLWNAALFEFHAIAFAPLFLLAAAYAYVRRRFWWFLLWATLACLVREDVALIVAMFGIVELMRWKKVPGTFFWITIPLLLGMSWFFIATSIIAAQNLSGAYTFLGYYDWIARSNFFGIKISGFLSVLFGVVTHPLRVLGHILSIGSLDALIGLLLPFLFLPLLRGRWLLLALPPFFQLFLAEAGASSLIVELHYGLLFLPALTMSAVAGFQQWHDSQTPLRIRAFLKREVPLPRRIAVSLFVCIVLAASYLIGPFSGIKDLVFRGASEDDRIRRDAYETVLVALPEGASVASSYAAASHVAAQHETYLLAYAYLGVNQYARRPYVLHDDLRYIILDVRDLETFAVQFPATRWSAPYARGGVERLRTILEEGNFRIAAERAGVYLLERGGSGASLPESVWTPAAEGRRGAFIVDALRDVTLVYEE